MRKIRKIRVRATTARRAALVFLLHLSLIVPVLAQSSDAKIPRKTSDVVNTLERVAWQEIEPGLSALRVVTDDLLILTAFRISPERFSFSLVSDTTKSGGWAYDIGQNEDAVIVVNGGFFAISDKGNLFPVGYLRIGGFRLAKGWHHAGGYLSLENGTLSISPAAKGIPAGSVDVLQSKPLMIEPGNRWAMRTNQGNIKRRTMICLKPDGEVLLVMITHSGLSLYEAGWLLRGRDVGGYFECDSALALDGGRSTQIWVADHPGYTFDGVTPVQNFLMLKRR